jgi:hypothetical protein
MPRLASLIDLERDLRFSLHEVIASGSRDENYSRLERLKYHALTLWHEAGKPLPFIAHIGPFIRIEGISNAGIR